MRRRLACIFATALLLRLAYLLLIYASMGATGLQGPDSADYLALARQIASGEAAFFATTPDMLVTNLMPLFPWLLAVASLVGDAVLPFVLFQTAVDSASCVIIALCAARLDQRLLFPAGVLAALNPTQIVFAAQVYPDTLFLAFVALMLLAALSWLRNPIWRWALVLGAAAGLATITRMLILPWLFALPVLLLATRSFGRGLGGREVWQMAAVLILSMAMVAPVSVRNKIQYDSWALTDQAGAHLLYWVTPMVLEAGTGMSRDDALDRVQSAALAYGATSGDNGFALSARRTRAASEVLLEAGAGAVLRAWLTGITINLAAPATLLSPPVAALPRMGFYASQADGFLDKVRRFVFTDGDSRYRAALTIGGAGVLVWAGLAVLGGIAALRGGSEAMAMMAILVAWTAYILMVNGPVASPKYRLPIEPVWIILAASGARAIAVRLAPGWGNAYSSCRSILDHWFGREQPAKR